MYCLVCIWYSNWKLLPMRSVVPFAMILCSFMGPSGLHLIPEWTLWALFPFMAPRPWLVSSLHSVPCPTAVSWLYVQNGTRIQLFSLLFCCYYSSLRCQHVSPGWLRRPPHWSPCLCLYLWLWTSLLKSKLDRAPPLLENISWSSSRF